MSTAKAWRWSSDGTMEPGPVLPEPDTACSEVLGCFVQRVLVVGHNENFAADEQPIHSHKGQVDQCADALDAQGGGERGWALRPQASPPGTVGQSVPAVQNTSPGWARLHHPGLRY